MAPTRLLLLLPFLAVLVLSGCQISRSGQGGSADDLQAENDRLSQDVARLTSDNAQLRSQLADARANMGKGASVGQQLGRILNPENLGEGVTATEGGGIALSEDLLFAKGSDELNEDGKRALGRIASRLNEAANASAKVFVEGHTDNTPVARHSTKEKFTDNWGLSAARAAAVVRALQGDNVSPTRIVGRFRGEHSPRATDGEKAKNRRVEIYLAD